VPNAAELDPAALIVGELASGWEAHAGPIRDRHPQVSVVVQWPEERSDAFAVRAMSQMARRRGPSTVLYASNGRLDRAAIQARARVLEAVLERSCGELRLVLVAPRQTQGGIPAWAASLADRLRFKHPRLSVTIRTEARPEAA
jgi:hypothetical protein